MPCSWKPLYLLSLFCLSSIVLSSCAANYQRYGKTPCENLSASYESLRKIALETGSKEEDIVLTDYSLRYNNKKEIIFSDIKKVIVTTGRKSFAKGRKYRLIVVMKNSLKRHHLITFDYFLAVDVYNRLECAAGIPAGETTKNINLSSPDLAPQPSQPLTLFEKYELIAKLKSLLDSGAITQQEFDSEKRKLFE
ncbi:SHOCT domain-containing protein [Sporocytophaga myxococcoides]|uniref:SHOCT domain-containing protein n=1 Tax=Sporocytophaga myxococcoides TaxID=153721 RepID=UPI0004228C99|nr:SHOCT domain-containing protein [Sporocytophaga myxococcoides]